MVPVLCYGYDALVLGLANCSGRGLADSDVKSVSSSEPLVTTKLGGSNCRYADLPNALFPIIPLSVTSAVIR